MKHKPMMMQFSSFVSSKSQCAHVIDALRQIAVHTRLYAPRSEDRRLQAKISESKRSARISL